MYMVPKFREETSKMEQNGVKNLALSHFGWNDILPISYSVEHKRRATVMNGQPKNNKPTKYSEKLKDPRWQKVRLKVFRA